MAGKIACRSGNQTRFETQIVQKKKKSLIQTGPPATSERLPTMPRSLRPKESTKLTEEHVNRVLYPSNHAHVDDQIKINEDTESRQQRNHGYL